MPDEAAGQEPTEQPQQPKPGPDAPKEPQTFTADYVKELRAEAAKYRTELKSIRDEFEGLKTQAEKAAETELAEQGKWKELAEKNAQKLAAYEAQAKEWETAQSRLSEAVTAQREGLPESITELLEAMSPVQQLDWLAKHRADYLTNKPQQNGLVPNLASLNPTGGNSVKETDRQRLERLRRSTGQTPGLFG